MRQRRNHRTPTRKLELRKETVRALDQKVLDDQQLAQVAGGTWYPRKSCNCTG
ncbi:MAG TPA: hypothetical protein VFU21_25375 [Kofleriaceae bacterium]|nr:hypothetical protein [Kofleriaceae bacterium]